MVHVVRQHLRRAQQRIKAHADKNRTDREFNMGDSVYLKLQPYVQTSIAARANHKLSFKYFGPYAVLQRIGKAAYKLRLPLGATVHPIFHVSQLKLSKGDNQVSATLPGTDSSLQVHLQVMDKWVISREGSPVQQVLVRWSQSDAALDSWEDEEALRAKFPKANAWGQAFFRGGGNVSSSGIAEGHSEDGAGETALEGPQDRMVGRRTRKPSSRISSAK
jgi:hypothetical protein